MPDTHFALKKQLGVSTWIRAVVLGKGVVNSDSPIGILWIKNALLAGLILDMGREGKDPPP